MSTPSMLRDFAPQRGEGGHPIQVLAPDGTGLQMTISEAGSTRIGPFPIGAVVRIWSQVTCKFRMGGAAVVAAEADVQSVPLTGGQAEFYRMRGNTFIAAISRAGSGSGLFHAVELL